jgi:predicted esterase
MPVRLFHGEVDSVVPAASSQKMASALQAAGADAQYTEFAGVDHNAWDAAYDRADLFAWLFAQKRH